MKKLISAVLIVCILGVLPPAALASGIIETVSAPQWDEAGSFRGGFAAVCRDGKWGYINESGELAIPLVYDKAYDFNEGVALVATMHSVSRQVAGLRLYTYKLIDRSGNTVVTLGSDDDDVTPVRVHSFFYTLVQNGYIAAGVGPYNGTVVYSFKSVRDVNPFEGLTFTGGSMLVAGGISYVTNPSWSKLSSVTGGLFINKDGAYLTPKSAPDGTKVTKAFPFNQGLAPVMTETGWGFIDTSGKWVITPKYRDVIFESADDCRVFRSGLAAVSDGSGKWGAIDKSGKVIVPFSYDDIYISDGCVRALTKNHTDFFDFGGKAVLSLSSECSPFSCGYAAMRTPDGRWCYIDKNGIEAASSTFDDVYIMSGNGIGKVMQNGKYGFVRISGDPPSPAWDLPADWAVTEVNEALSLSLVPAAQRNAYAANINRIDFAGLVTTLIEKKTGVSAEAFVLNKTGVHLDKYAYAFDDVSNRSVSVCFALGIINGRSATVFDPYGEISREEAAKMLALTAAALGADITAPPNGFPDREQFSSWSPEFIDYVSDTKVMLGMATGFGPREKYTRQQSFMTIVRLYKALG